MLRANHFVNSHEQGVRTMGRAGRAHSEQLAPGSARTGGGHELVALVVRHTIFRICVLFKNERLYLLEPTRE